MPDELPLALRALKRFLVQANQVAKVNAKVAYYLRLFCVTSALKQPKEHRDKTVNKFISSLMDRLEKDRETITPPIDTQTDAAEMKAFALQVFLHADSDDRSGGASKNTAKAFLSAAVFMEALAAFGQSLDSDIEEKIRYAQWKAAQIVKAIREGRTPKPGAANEIFDEDDDEDDNIVSTNNASKEFSSSSLKNQTSHYMDDHNMSHSEIGSVYSSADDEITSLNHTETTSISQKHTVMSNDDGKVNSSLPTHQRLKIMTSAEKAAREAIAALRFSDLKGAQTRLQSALNNVNELLQHARNE